MLSPFDEWIIYLGIIVVCSIICFSVVIEGSTREPACAVCKFQRRKCPEGCSLAPYFPADDPKKFEKAHNLFGVSNMQRLLNQAPRDKRDLVMETIIIESDIRDNYRVHGCLAVINQYSFLIKHAEERLRCAKKLIEIYKGRLPADPGTVCRLHAMAKLDIMPSEIEGDHLPTYEQYLHYRVMKLRNQDAQMVEQNKQLVNPICVEREDRIQVDQDDRVIMLLQPLPEQEETESEVLDHGTRIEDESFRKEESSLMDDTQLIELDA